MREYFKIYLIQKPYKQAMKLDIQRDQTRTNQEIKYITFKSILEFLRSFYLPSPSNMNKHQYTCT